MIGMNNSASLSNFKYLRDLKKENLEKQYSQGLDTSYIAKFSIYSNATILPFKKNSDFNGLGGVVDESNCFIELSAEKFASGKYEFNNVTHRKERVCYCGHMIHQWGHFLMDSISRIWYCLKNDDTVDKYVFFSAEGDSIQLNGNYRNFFELLGIWDKIEIINKPTAFSEVIIPEKGFVGGEYFASNFLEVFDKISENITIDPNWNTYKKIYFTRKAYSKALCSDLGIEMLDNYFEKNGFTLVSPERLSLSEMIYLIRNAEVVASISGSVCHNMLFAKNNQELIILERTILNNDYQIGVNIARELKTTIIDSNIAIYPVEIGFGPFIITYTGKLQEFTEDNHWLAPDEVYTNDKYLIKLFKAYMKQYKRNYQDRWILEEWMIPHINYLREAYKESEERFAEYLQGSKPYKLSQYFSIGFIKYVLRRILKR